MTTRQDCINKIRKVEDLLSTIKLSDNLYDATNFKEHLSERLDYFHKEMEKYPLGHKYKGVYYKKMAGSHDFEKLEGSLYMRNDLISWIDLNPEIRYKVYMRNLYIEPDYSKPLKREHGKPIFSRDEL